MTWRRRPIRYSVVTMPHGSFSLGERSQGQRNTNRQFDLRSFLPISSTKRPPPVICIVIRLSTQFIDLVPRAWIKIKCGEFSLRQIDVIAEWERVDLVKELPLDAIISHRQVWRPGLRFEDFAGGELDLETSKTQTKAIFDVTVYPLFQQALSAVPDSDRNGPLVTDEDGVPLRRRYYQELYREVGVARA